MARVALALVVAVHVSILIPAPLAHAEDVAPPRELVISVEDYARLVGLAGQVAPLQAEKAALEASLANLTEQRDHALELARVRGELRDAYRELATINAAKYEATKDAWSEDQKRRRTGAFWTTVRQRAAEGGLIGVAVGSVFPGVGNLAAGAGGYVLGGLVGAIESLTQGP